MPDNSSYEYVVQVQSHYTDWLMQKRDVIGVSVGLWDMVDDLAHYCLVVLVTVYHTPDELDPQDRIPEALDGVPVRVQDVGTLTADLQFSANG
jgi:hypothetical protein